MNLKRVYVGLGSNVQPDYYLCRCLQHLEATFGSVQCSTIYQTKAVGFEGADFLNGVVCFQTTLALPDLKAYLKQLELMLGRKRGAEPYLARTLDADLLLYEGEALAHKDIERYPFVLYPLLELDAALIHPLHQLPLQRLAEQWQLARTDMRPYELNCS